MGFLTTLTLILIVLKLFKLISWSWLWILSPIWITASILLMQFSILMLAGRSKKGHW